MQQILEQVKERKTPLKLNGFINGGSIQIIRDNPLDTLHFGKEISLTIYNRKEIVAARAATRSQGSPAFPPAQKSSAIAGAIIVADQRNAGHPYRIEEKRCACQSGL